MNNQKRTYMRLTELKILSKIEKNRMIDVFCDICLFLSTGKSS